MSPIKEFAISNPNKTITITGCEVTNDLSFKHFMEIYQFDIEKYFGQISISDKEEAYLVYIDTELVGILVGNKEND